MKNNHTEYQYNRCSARGICSVNPATASLQEVILLYLSHASYYALKLSQNGIKDKNIINLILNTISVLSSNYEISEVNFGIINETFKKELPRIIKEFIKIYPDEKNLNTESLLNNKTDINDYIRYGEKELKKRIEKINQQERSLYKILFVLIKSLCINILIYESYGQEAEDEILLLLTALCFSDYSEKDKLKEFIIKIAEKDSMLMNKIYDVREEKYGQQAERDVSFSSRKGHAVLVVGSNIRELEQILDVLAKEDIDVYTHDNMKIAHAFPEFKKYEHLVGQFGQGMENCLLDFSTFPGPIIFTRYSLFNVENLYRGRLYTTDFSYSQGVIAVKNSDFSEVIKSAKESKGFKTGKECESETVGFSLNELSEKIKMKLASGIYNQVVIIGPCGYSSEEREYFNTFIKHVPDDVLIISFVCYEKNDNFIYVNTAGDIYGINRILDYIQEVCALKTTYLFPYLDRHSLSIVIKTTEKESSRIFAGKWNQAGTNPSITKGLQSEFSISVVTSPKNDIQKMFNVN